MGLGSNKSTWQRQTLYFGHERGDTYSSLVFDNRGMGASDTPLLRYSTSEMAKDCIELLDHLGWTEDRQLNITGVSMGGMIAQELVSSFPCVIATGYMVLIIPTGIDDTKSNCHSQLAFHVRVYRKHHQLF